MLKALHAAEHGGEPCLKKGDKAARPLGEICNTAELCAVVKEALCGENSFMGCDPDNVTPSASLRDDLGLDSLDHAELALTLEDMLGIEVIQHNEIDAYETGAGDTVADVMEMMRGKKVINPAAIKLTMARIEANRTADADLQKKVDREMKALRNAKREPGAMAAAAGGAE